MAWSFSGHRGSANSKTSGAVLSVAPTGAIAANSILVAVCASDNIVTAGGQSTSHLVADPLANGWRRVREHTNAAVAAAGITGSVWATQISSALATSDIVVQGIRSAAAAKAIGLYEFSVAADFAPAFVAATSSEQDGTTAPTVTLSGLPADQTYAFLGVCFREDDNVSGYTQDASFTDRQNFGTTGGTGNTNASCIVGTRVAELSSCTFSPTLNVAADVVTILIAMREVTEFPSTSVTVTFSNGSMFLQLGPERIDVDPAYAKSLMQGGNKRLDFLLYAIALECIKAGINPNDTAACATYINGRTFTF